MNDAPHSLPDDWQPSRISLPTPPDRYTYKVDGHKRVLCALCARLARRLGKTVIVGAYSLGACVECSAGRPVACPECKIAFAWTGKSCVCYKCGKMVKLTGARKTQTTKTSNVLPDDSGDVVQADTQLSFF